MASALRLRLFLLVVVFSLHANVIAGAGDNDNDYARGSRFFQDLGAKAPSHKFSGSGGQVRVMHLGEEQARTLTGTWLVELNPQGLLLPTSIPGATIAMFILQGTGRPALANNVGLPLLVRDVTALDALYLQPDSVFSFVNTGSGTLQFLIFAVARDPVFFPFRWDTLTGGHRSVLKAVSPIVIQSGFNVSLTVVEEVLNGAVSDNYVTTALPELVSSPMAKAIAGSTNFTDIFSHAGNPPTTPIGRFDPVTNSIQSVSFATAFTPGVLLNRVLAGARTMIFYAYINNAARVVYVNKGRVQIEFATPSGIPVFNRTLTAGQVVIVPAAYPIVFYGPCDSPPDVGFDIVAFITFFPPTAFLLEGQNNLAAGANNIYNTFSDQLLDSAFQGASPAAVQEFFSSTLAVSPFVPVACPT
eukprot:jgi/Chlat1/727/Chrsp104S01213